MDRGNTLCNSNHWAHHNGARYTKSGSNFRQEGLWNRNGKWGGHSYRMRSRKGGRSSKEQTCQGTADFTDQLARRYTLGC